MAERETIDSAESRADVRQLGLEVSAWPFREARQLLEKRCQGQCPAKGHVLFETGYGPSGRPHIGTFGEVVRTTMVRRAFRRLAPEIPTRLVCFSDDMDGLRKVPDNVPNAEMMAAHIGMPLTRVPDPFGAHPSFGQHNNARLREFLDSFGFEYEFTSATECYTGGRFDEALMRVLAHYDEILEVILPTLGPERQRTYSPFLPVSPKSGRVLQAPVLERDPERGTIVFEDEDGSRQELPVTGGHVKLQWKCDWAMRWYAFGVDYEMSGKDLSESVGLSGRICRILGGRPPNGMTFEMFLDENGGKISKSRGNGLAVEDWLRYAPGESLAWFMYQKPQAARRLHFDVIPKNVDDYLVELQEFPVKNLEQRMGSPVWHIHDGEPPRPGVGAVSFSMLLNLVSVCHSDDPKVLWHYVGRYAPGASPESSPFLDDLIGYAIRYYSDFVRPAKRYRKATGPEREALGDLSEGLRGLGEGAGAEEIQTLVYEVGKRHECFPGLRDWFAALYQILLGQDSGPRVGSFIALYGVDETVRLLERAISGEDLA
jgi:lysyl-tRNA synthetase class 1